MIVVALTWATASLNVFLLGILASGILVASVEAFVRKHEGTPT